MRLLSASAVLLMLLHGSVAAQRSLDFEVEAIYPDIEAARLDESRRSGISVPAPHSPEWAPDYEPTLKAAIRADVAALLELLR